ncbi:MAG: hypothetical protein VX367_10010 [SAR324 cluster bacterium]|nr:hypothetical protein [SAR324 cluster bacterium]
MDAENERRIAENDRRIEGEEIKRKEKENKEEKKKQVTRGYNIVADRWTPIHTQSPTQHPFQHRHKNLID